MNTREFAETIAPLKSVVRGRAEETLVFDHGSNPRRIGQYSDAAIVQMIHGCEDGGWFQWVARNQEAIEFLESPASSTNPGLQA